jgi:hypothetical protein
MNGHIATYLNDHLAGATAGIEIAQHLIDNADPSTKERLSPVKTAIEEDHQTLKSLMKDLGIEESTLRKAAGWLSEKVTELKLGVDDEGDGEFKVFEALELLSLGIEGKRCLWRALAAASVSPDGLDLDSLILRAEEQRSVVETLRIGSARVLARSKK